MCVSVHLFVCRSLRAEVRGQLWSWVSPASMGLTHKSSGLLSKHLYLLDDS